VFGLGYNTKKNVGWVVAFGPAATRTAMVGRLVGAAIGAAVTCGSGLGAWLVFLGASLSAF
jgi:hypothetical protein